jgi:hypothetical protein
VPAKLADEEFLPALVIHPVFDLCLRIFAEKEAFLPAVCLFPDVPDPDGAHMPAYRRPCIEIIRVQKFGFRVEVVSG